MNSYGIFDIIGPVMIGPSSSHTAGANRIGNIARAIAGSAPVRVFFYLHGSFYKTRMGHGTDKALLAGIMGIPSNDERIRDAFSIAKEKNIEYTFAYEDLGDVHPNSVKVLMETSDGKHTQIIGSSIGGGKVMITRINSTEVAFDGEYTTLITKHYDKPGVISKVTRILADFDVNIAFMKVFRHSKGDFARLIIQLDEDIDEEIAEKITALSEIKETKLIKSIK